MAKNTVNTLKLSVPSTIDADGFISLPSNKILVVFSDGTEKLCTVGHRKVFEDVTLPDGRKTTVKTSTMWIRPVSEAPSAPVKPTKNAEAPKTAPVADPTDKILDAIGALMGRIEALEAAKKAR